MSRRGLATRFVAEMAEWTKFGMILKRDRKLVAFDKIKDKNHINFEDEEIGYTMRFVLFIIVIPTLPELSTRKSSRKKASNLPEIVPSDILLCSRVIESNYQPLLNINEVANKIRYKFFDPVRKNLCQSALC